MAKHTPGKWELGDENDYGCEVVLPNDSVISMSRDTRYSEGYVMSRDEMLANARLIAHAPAMLEMLQTIVEDMEQYDGATISIKDIKELIKSATTE